MKNPLRVDEMINPHVSVDCVVLGFDGEHLKVLLVKQTGHEESGYYNNMELPGSLITMTKTWTRRHSGFSMN